MINLLANMRFVSSAIPEILGGSKIIVELAHDDVYKEYYSL